MDNDWEYLHGRVDPGQDENLNLLESVEVEVPGDADLEQRNTLSSPEETDESSNAPQGVLGMFTNLKRNHCLVLPFPRYIFNSRS